MLVCGPFFRRSRCKNHRLQVCKDLPAPSPPISPHVCPFFCLIVPLQFFTCWCLLLSFSLSLSLSMSLSLYVYICTSLSRSFSPVLRGVFWQSNRIIAGRRTNGSTHWARPAPPAPGIAGSGAPGLRRASVKTVNRAGAREPRTGQLGGPDECELTGNTTTQHMCN